MSKVRGLTSGCFDLCHVGHILYLQRCKLQCSELIVGVDSDELVAKTKGPKRPIIPENERLDLVRNLGFIDEAFILKAAEDLETVAAELKVQKVFKHQNFQGMKNVYGTMNTGAKLVIIPDIPGLVSSSEIIKRIVERYREPT
jgi:cytidyltransferase-like protein